MNLRIHSSSSIPAWPSALLLILIALKTSGCAHQGATPDEGEPPRPILQSEPGADSESLYSAVALSAAIIVGLLGGILAMRLQEQRARASEHRHQAIQALRDLDEALKQQLARLSGFVEHWPGQARFLGEQRAKGRSEFSYQGDWYHPDGVSPSQNGSIESALASEPVFQEVKAKVLPVLQRARKANGPEQAAEVLERGLGRSDIELLKDHLGALRAHAKGRTAHVRP
jgi:hypothetical protein